MLEKIDLSKKVDKKTYRRVMDEAEEKLGLLQRECKDAGIPVILVFEGMGAAGKGVQINRLIQALDPRGFDVYACDRPTEDEQMRPFLWRYWTKTPAKGRIAVFDRSWYRSVQVDRFDGLTPEDKLGDAYQDILSFEKQLCDDGTVIMKFFLYIDKDEQKRRFKKLEGSKETSWRVTDEDWNRNKYFGRYLKMNEEMLEKTDTDYAPWVIIEAVDKDYAALKIASTVMDLLEYELEHSRPEEEKTAQGQEAKIRERFKNGVLSGIDLSKSLTEEEYKTRLKKLQKRLAELHSELYRLRIPVVIGFEGWDAGGKGGAIKRLTSNLDPRGYRVNPTAAPNDIEKVHHYLWRFWNNVPKAGHIAVFDRTWYGRVMVERIEGFCSEAQWRRAYQEINEMESHMANAGAVVLKFWLHIDKDEQERRFRERQANPAKQWKITDEDWRNREKWDQYEEAVNEMLIRTSTTYAPWIVVEGNDKRYARVKVLQTVVDALEKKIKEVKTDK
ncbi:polyphosphate:AMP phosphotransferase [Enterocloster clostridioformis]|uniref:Polyphosphate:AMP phosphotransferase n=1 Tax=Enterocloster clostridioformis TaxID=1531 RepID=A0A1I0H3L7_9FIRM|nr:polyphosphate:AMP phosphotransferase [Enterocloster clostridioformis]SET78184.1 polyphosphate:AMP phosphotransferase [Enterocloster clostridioformis]SEV85788.1 polyphosphate:AMP phosphotransferase [Enterocloster clostridioformis]